MSNKLHIIVVGTDPASYRGGIASALPGYFRALEYAGISNEFIPTHHATARGGKWRYWVFAFPKIAHSIYHSRNEWGGVVVYAHVGGGIPSFVRKSMLALFVRLLGVPVVMHLHGPEVARYLATPWRKFFFRMALVPASAVCVLTSWWKDILQAAKIDKPVNIVPNPLDEQCEMTALTPVERNETKDSLTVVSMARIENGKGVDVLIEAVPLLPGNVYVVVAGNGAQLSKLKKRVRDLSIDQRVQFLGWVEGEDKLRLLKNADIFCLPSCHDSFGMGFVEAMAYGLPVIALDWGPIHDVVPDGECGILINQPDPKHLANEIANLSENVELRKRMGKNGQHWVYQQFGVHKVGEKLRMVMEEVCN